MKYYAYNPTLINIIGLKSLNQLLIMLKLFYHEHLISQVQSENSPDAMRTNYASYPLLIIALSDAP